MTFCVAVEVSSVDVPNIHDLPLLLDNDAGWTQEVGFVDSRFVEMCWRYCGATAALKLIVLRTNLQVFRTGSELLSCNTVLRTRIQKARTCERDTEEVRETADVKFARTCCNADELVL